MVDFDIDMGELQQFIDRLANQEKQIPKVAKRLLRRVGSRARTLTAKKAKKLVRKQTGRYHKSIKRGKLWVNQDEYKIRVFSGSKRAHLLEYGHRIVGRKGKEHGFKEGAHVFSKAKEEIDQQMNQMIEEEFEKMLEKL